MSLYAIAVRLFTGTEGAQTFSLSIKHFSKSDPTTTTLQLVNLLIPSFINCSFFLQEQFHREEQLHQEQSRLQTTPPNRHLQNVPVSWIKRVSYTDCMLIIAYFLYNIVFINRNNFSHSPF